MPVSRRLGCLTITAVEDGAGPFFTPRCEAFPTATEAQWAAADAFDPGSVTRDGRWWLRFRAFAIVDGSGRTTMVDTGIGPVDPTVAAWTPVPGVLPEVLAAAGIAVADVTTVVQTHLHSDHTGWAVVPDGPRSDSTSAEAAGALGPGHVPSHTARPDAARPSSDVGSGRRVFFPNARYVIQRADAEALAPPQDARLLAPLRDSGQLHLVDGDHRLSREVTTVHTPGHTPGHQSVLVSHGTESLLITGDLLVHAIQLLFPELPYAHEDDPGLARETRRRFGDATLATSHLSRAFVEAPR